MQRRKPTASRTKFLYLLAITFTFSFLIFAFFMMPTQVAKVAEQGTPQSTVCHNNIKAITLLDQCGDQSFRQVAFECKAPVTTSGDLGLVSNKCYSIADLTGLVNRACSSCQVETESVPSLLFSPSQATGIAGSTFTVSIIVDTADQPINGAGAKITFDPAYLQGVSIQPGTIFANYATTSIDNATGKIVISAISNSLSDSFTGLDSLATITFRVVKTGLTNANFVFTPGSTTDSNLAVTTGNGDILERVNTLQVVPQTGKPTSTPKPSRYPLPTPRPVPPDNRNSNEQTVCTTILGRTYCLN